ncbi:unnamed protein product [Polarella glacialis]|uniref:Phosphatidic acid phosphatase type 2/haloperoxidase domain-containing protein n=1 Tax=Polarella glacialis TaxID=89957 RepID=A0A813LG64_POLGL|nr:unnamed protein product [Polarella glacialis]CAE8726872.1 unnamed protein product [Polarella glacialis]
MPSRKIFNFTYVLYEENNPLSQLLAIATLSPMLVAFGLGAAFVVTRRVAWAWALAGALAVDVICRILKDVINQPRPESSYREGPGMPSEHAAFSTFLAVHLSLWLWSRTCCRVPLKIVGWAALNGWAAVVVFSRYHLGVHSVAQLAVGAVIGIVAGMLSFTLEGYLGDPWLAKVQRSLDRAWNYLEIEFEDYGESHTD